ncbi:hypothetical protein [Encephalitozoon cuniculi GB-M1]|uniref:Uncharacterized protein n=1 Tax=Encephalitozoon cuniculi (strain GB-M1) TaxID=284813 RepID=Q8SWA3_ENCCU|nr:uncharacterized protein ECU02_1280 [Encephalitozoon cuniculi GB-M1]CAD25157.1 hypothetical protein [Encephalitozoon cuniculi GB-M1]
MDEKLKEVSRLMKEIKVKIEAIIQSSAHVREFNYKMEALLAAFEAYTVHGVRHDPEVPRTPMPIVPSVESIVKESIEEGAVAAASSKVRREENLEEFMRRMESNTAGNNLFRNNATKIARFLYANREGVALEEVIKNTGISRYRCVDILNSMLKADPPLVSKRFDKGFIYSIVLL